LKSKTSYLPEGSSTKLKEEKLFLNIALHAKSLITTNLIIFGKHTFMKFLELLIVSDVRQKVRGLI